MVLVTGLPLTVIAAVVSTMCFLSAFGAVDVGETNVSLLWFLPFGFFFAIPALGLPLWELYIFLGRDEIELSPSRLQMIQRLGPLRWTTRIPLRTLESFNVPPMRSSFGWNPSGDALVAELSDRGGKESVLLLRHYSNNFLEKVAAYLSDQINELHLHPGDGPVTTVSENREDRLQQPLSEQPHESRIRVEQSVKNLILHIPPTGLLKHGGGVGAVTCAGFVGTLIIASVAAFNLDLEIMVGFLIFFSFLSVLCFGIFIWAFNAARRTTTLRISPDALKVEQQAPFGTRTYRWRSDEIEAVDVAPSRYATSPYRDRDEEWQPMTSLHSPQGAGINREQQQVAALRVFPTDEEPVDFFPGRDDQELRWLATLVRREILSER